MSINLVDFTSMFSALNDLGIDVYLRLLIYGVNYLLIACGSFFTLTERFRGKKAAFPF